MILPKSQSHVPESFIDFLTTTTTHPMQTQPQLIPPFLPLHYLSHMQISRMLLLPNNILLVLMLIHFIIVIVIVLLHLLSISMNLGPIGRRLCILNGQKPCMQNYKQYAFANTWELTSLPSSNTTIICRWI